MAATRWTDPTNWTFADCSDVTKQPLISHLIDVWRQAADERVAFSFLTHESGFPSSRIFPEFLGAIIDFSNNNASKIRDSIYPEEVIETADIPTSGTFTGSSDIAADISLNDLLLGPLGYASGILLHITETNDGAQNALFRMAWFVQWFDVMNYPEFYNRPITDNLSIDYFSDIDRQLTKVDVTYKFNVGTASFVSATAFLTTPLVSSTPVDIYIANDLNESAPFSTHANVRDYADGLLAANSATWADSTGSLTHDIQASISLLQENAGGVTTFNATISNSRIRFKVKEQFRATSPDTFVVPVHWNGVYQEGSGAGDPTYDFGSGETDLEMQFFELSKIGDFFFLEIIQISGTLPDYTGYAVPGVDGTVSAVLDRTSFSSAGGGNANTNCVFFGPNVDDGTSFLWYKP